MRRTLLLLFLAVPLALLAQLPKLERIEPSFWWVGMKNPNLQLLVHGKDISKNEVSINYAGVKLMKVNQVDNPNYLFLDLLISADAPAGKFDIVFSQNGKQQAKYTYELKTRNANQQKFQGVTNKDFIYLIMPDRFANGDTKNDVVKGMNETALNRDSMYYRHGGDLKGIAAHLDYLQELGVTALWLNPVLENNQPKTSYHGYANTENYKIDPRFGTNEDYRQLVADCHQRGMKMIKDLVHNHFGTEHFTIKDMPTKDWVHQWPTYTKTTYREQVHFDPYVSKKDKDLMLNGWFDRHMPDLNQNNEFVKNYLTQSHIWWIEYADLDGFRLDTYAYNDAKFMAEWGKRIMEEYPKFTFFGETWVHGVPNQAFFTKGNKINQGIDTELQGVTDFQALWAINEALNGKFGWTDGVVRLYNTLTNDYMYEDPTRNVVFLDNHDISRFYSVVGEDFDKYKSGIAWLLTTRGIPQFYYGTEILMKNYANPDGLVRSDFAGGWATDKVNKFSSTGRTAKENEAFNYVKKLANYRKNNEVLQTGKMMQFIPEDGIYVYFRYNNQKTVMVVMNGNTEAKTLSTDRFSEMILGRKAAKNVVSDELLADISQLKIPAKTTLVLELQ
ncbi:glycoside hydrolase family 13 protein [Nubsella zeaxanthinifaciens]|jgi:glycosidase|uniref:glycoside hydrolase family 13 protein n=1 Tax=Nubsella zeaxanthinifaciens TaxID=392412 RepID=UPI000DE52EB1|nr:glycoside hydrolase family 13 protein [Nubsella zeaxanthinifaciens]